MAARREQLPPPGRTPRCGRVGDDSVIIAHIRKRKRVVGLSGVAGIVAAGGAAGGAVPGRAESAEAKSDRSGTQGGGGQQKVDEVCAVLASTESGSLSTSVGVAVARAADR